MGLFRSVVKKVAVAAATIVIKRVASRVVHGMAARAQRRTTRSSGK